MIIGDKLESDNDHPVASSPAAAGIRALNYRIQTVLSDSLGVPDSGAGKATVRGSGPQEAASDHRINEIGTSETVERY
eukprot:766254-Hanusia_phi.AAC.7